MKMHLSMPLLAVYGLILSLFVTDTLQQARKCDIVFLIDGSPGMGRSFALVREFLKKVIPELDIGPDKDQVAVVQYSFNPRLEFGLNTYSTKDEVLDAIKKLKFKTGKPLNTGAALDYVTNNVFSPSAGSRRDAGASQILVLITAGKSRDDVGQAAEAVKQAGIVSIAIGAKGADTSELQQIVSNPDSILKLRDFRELQTIQQELLSKIRPVFVVEEPILPTEALRSSEPIVQTMEGPTVIIGVTSEIENRRDIVFLIDESDYIGNSNLPYVLDFITRIIENLNIGSDRVRVGLVLYSNTAETEFYLNTYSRKDEVLSLLRALRFKGGMTLNTGKALDFVLRYHFTRSAGSRREEGVPQFLVLITGGRSGDDIKPSADALKRAAIITLTVGARNTDPAQLKEVAFEPSLAFNVRDFNFLSDMQEKVMTSLQRLHVQSVPIEEATILIQGPLVTSTKVSSARKSDIVFLIDGSAVMGRSFPLVREFLKKVILELEIGPDKDQVAVVQYSFNPRLEFGLNTYSTKDEVLDAIKKLKFKTGKPLNTGAALDYVTNNVFSPSAGSRRDAGASQILVLITAGKSRDDVGQAADAVKQAGIVSIAIGAKSADTSELQQIVSNADSVLKLRDFRELQTIQQELRSKIRPVFVIEEPIVVTQVLPMEMNKRDIVFLIDGSDNVGNRNLPFVRDFITRIIQNLAIGSDKVQVGLAQYSDDTEAEFYLNTYSSENELLSHIRSLSLRGGTTVNTGSALDFAIKYYFTSSTGSRIKENVPQFLVLVTGGRSSDDVEAPADALKRAAVMTFAVGVKHSDPAQLEEIAIDPSLIFNVKEFHSLSDIENQMLVPLTTLTVPTVIIEEPTIKTEEEPVPTAEAKKRDIVFLFEGSTAMGRSFPLVREFLKKVIPELDIGPDKDQVAVVQYSSNPRLEFGLNTYSTKDDVLDAIKKLKFKTGRSLNTGAALDYVTNNVFNPTAGSRRDAGASQILVLITAGKSRDDVGQAADAVKQAGIVSIAIGAKGADTSELQKIVSNPDSVLKLRDFQELQTIQQELLAKIRPVFVVEEPIPPTEVVPMEMSERDIVFLIDGSDNVGNRNLPFVRDFITRIIQNLAIGSDKVRVGLAQYSDDTEAEFYLNTYSSENELLSHIRSLSLRGGTTVNTGSALDFAIKYYFTSSAGSRIKENVPQFLVLVTGGRSSDDVEAPADALKRAAVMTFAVGVKHSDPAQLEEIAIDPSLIFNVKEFHSLSDIENQMIVPLTTLTVPTVTIVESTIRIEEEPVPTTEARERDIVFLLDGSAAMGRSFLLVRKFLKKVILELDIGPDKDQVAVVQYSSNPRLEFGLNTYSTKDDVLDAIKLLKFKTGRSLNTGAALDYVTKNVFSPSTGSRRDAGASQILVLITAGKSTDEVGQAADAVNQAGIVPIAIGAKGADTSELQQIVSNPDSVLKLRDFRELQNIQQELLSKVRPVFVVEEPIPPTEVVPMEMSERDIVFLIDGSDNVGNRNLPFVRDFITRIIQNVAIGSDKVRVGLAQYSDDTEAEFYLNTYSSENELLSHIRSLSLRGGTTVNTGSALDFAIKYYFTSSAGSRIKENVPQFLVLVTGGRSSDDVEAPADALKRAAVMTFAVGVKHSDPAQLEEIAIDPSLIFNVKEFHSLSDIENQMIVPLTTLTVPSVTIVEPTIRIEEEPVPTTEARKSDIVFLIDGSPGMGRSFSLVREFLYEVIQELDIGSDKDQVAVVQYSFNPRLEFGLNTYSTKDEILDAIKKLKFKTGKPLNTGAALGYVTNNVFSSSAGSRRDAGTSQILVLITAGKSRDDVRQAAYAVKQAGIVSIAIGAKGADTSELQEIVSNPDSVLKLRDFQELQTIQQELLSKIRPVFVVEEPIPPTEVLPMEMSERDIVFLIDGSDNVGNRNLPFVRDFITRIIQNVAIGSDKVRVGLAQYSDDTEAEFYLNTYSSENELLSHIRSLSLRGGTTVNTGSALDFAIKYYFTSSAGSRIKENVPQFLVLVTGGRSSDDVEAPADALKRAAVMTFAVGVKHSDPAQLEEIAIDPSLIFNVKEFHSLSDIENQMIVPLTTLTVPSVTIVEPTIRIEEEPVPTTEVAPQERDRRDVVFLIDGSVGNVNFIHIRDFITKLIENLDVGSDGVQVAVAQYSNDVKTECYLNSYPTKADLVSRVKGLKVKGGRTVNTGAALDYVLRNHFTQSAGSRKEEGVPQILMLFTGGRSRDEIKSSADALKRAAVMTFSVGARKADPAQLKEISSDPSLVFSVKEFRSLRDIQDQVMRPLSTPVMTPLSTMIVPTVTTTEAAPQERKRRDVVFLIDGSVGNVNFIHIRDFITKLIENLDVGSDGVQVAVAQYSNDVKTECYLNSYPTKADLVSRVKGLKVKGGRTVNTGAALDYVLRNHFTQSAGSRKEEGVPQILMLFTGGRSRDEIKSSADALKRAAVMTFSVGARKADPAQLKEISSDPSLVFSVKEFRSLRDIQDQVMTPLSVLPALQQTTEEPTVAMKQVLLKAVSKRDIVFLIDGSDNVGDTDFPFVHDFLTSIIENLDIGSDRVQIGLVQYSNYAETEFYLNTYSSEDEILSHVEGLRLRGGMPLNTGAALDYVLKNHFTRSSGSRKEEGVPQILVLITAGRSRDYIKPSADALKQAAVTIFAVGARNADAAQVTEIASDRSLSLSVQEFRALPHVQEQVMMSMSTLPPSHKPTDRPTVPINPEKTSKRDIVFLIDGSDNVGHTDFSFVHDFLTSIIENLDIGSDRVQIGLVQYSNYAETEFYLNTYSSEDEILSHVEGLRLRGGMPLNTGAALDYILRSHFTRSSGSRKEEGVPQILVLITAGRSRDYTKPSADALKQAAVTIFAVGARNADAAQVTEIASDPSLSLSVQEFRALPHVQEQVMILMSTLPPSREPTDRSTVPINPVVADGTNKRDIVFLIDGSDNVGNADLPFIRDFITSIIENLDIGSDRVKIGLVQYSNYAETEFYLNTYSSEDEVLSHVEGLRLRGGMPLNTGAALDYVLRSHFTRSSGSRKEEGVPQILVLITAGRSSNDVKPSADALKHDAVITFAVGARNADPAQLKEIAVDPTLVFSVQEFRSLPQVQEQLMTPLTTLAASRVPIERPPVTEQVVPEEGNKRDIVFLIDGSDNIGNTNFAHVRDFLTSIIQNLDIGNDRIQVGLVQYSTYAETEFYLNTYLSKAEILFHIKGLRLKGGTRLNTGAALDYVYKYHFIGSAGSRRREGIPQFLVLLTGGRSSDDAKLAAGALKQAAIMNFAVGVKNADSAQLKEIAIDPSLVFSTNEFYSLPNIQEEVTTLLSTLPAPRTIPEEPTAVTKRVIPDGASKRDIVFLIDGSDYVGNTNFPFVRDFLTNIIENLNIGSDKIQIGLVQYSNYAETEFYLNTYSSEDEILSHVKGLRLRGGTTLNTGVALDSVLRYHFTRSAGSRKEEGVPQVLVLITSGRSRDDVKLPADTLKRAAVKIIAIGAENANPIQIKEIADDTSLVFSVEEFRSMPDILEQVMISLLTLAAPAVTHNKPTVITERPTDTVIEVTSEIENRRDIVFLIDESDYIGNSNLPYVRDFITRIIENLDIGSDRVRVGLVLYSNNAETEFYLNTYSRKDEVLSLLRPLRFKGGMTLNTGKALDFVLRYHFTRSAGSRREEGVPQFLVLITGGRSGDDIKPSADALKRAAIITLTVGARSADPAQLKEMAFEPSLAFNARDLYSLSEIQEKVMTPLQKLRDPKLIIDEPTVHIGDPMVTSTKARKSDIVFLIDGSPGMGRSFALVREFLKKVIQELDIGPDKDQVAVVQYSFNPRLEFGLNTYSTKDEVLDAIKKLKFKTGKPLNTGAALDYVTNNVFSPSAGSRRDAGASQILVLITAGKSRDDVGQAAEAVKQAGIVSIAIGAKGADTSELQQIVSNPDSVLKLRDFQELQTIQQELLSKIRPVFIMEKSTVTTEVLPKEMSERDIVFLIDGSDNVGNTNLPFVRDFMTRIIQNLAIGSDKVRVGLAQYSDDTEAEFYLNTYSSENELLSHIRSLSLRGGTTVNTGSALDFAIKYYFTSFAGSRIKENVPQFLVLVTGGRSSDDVEAPADALKRAAVMTFAVGVKHSDPAQLEEIAIDPSLIFNVKEFHSLSDIENQMIIPLTTLTVPTVIEEPIISIEEEVVTTTEARRRDIVFLIDGSPGMGRSFPLVRKFLMEVIQELDIGPDKDQVSVVQYSLDSRVEFGLGSHSTKDEVLNALQKLRLKTGRLLNTGAALDYVTKNVFSPSAGSRRDAGASQILVLITAGKSRDDVGQAADAVKQAGIVPIAIGAKGADTSELQQIVYEPNFVLKLRDFRELQTIQKELISKVKTVFIIEEMTTVNTEVSPEEVNKRDIVFLIDGSDNVGNTNLLIVHDFIKNIIENLNIGSDRVRIGLAQFSHDSQTEFYLNTYSKKAEILSHVKGLKLKGGTMLNTGAALDFVFRNHFTSHAGSRKEHGVPQFLVVFTGGRSVDAVKPYADALKRAAIATFAVGVRNADPAQLQEIATDPTLVFSVKEFHNLPHVQERVMTPLSTLSAPTVTIGESTVIAGEPLITNEEASAVRQRDIVFLIDGTLGMGKAFPLVRAFLMKVIQELDIAPDKDQVAVVQYSHNPKTEFGLNTYASKDEVLVATTQLRRKTGRALNTGAALNYVIRNVFITSAGSRQDTGATQILVLITAGKSRDDVGLAANAVKQAGIVSIAIGAKNAHSAELRQIVYSPDFMFVLKTFQTVPTIQQQLLSILKLVSGESLEDQPHRIT